MSGNSRELSIYKTPFSARYWKDAAGELKNVRILAIVALFIAIRIAMQGLVLPVGENLRIYFTFLVNALGVMIYGPVAGLVSGFAVDILGFFIVPTGGAFFPGYTLSTMLGSFFYAIFLYRSRISVVRIILSKVCVNILVNVGLGALWSAILYSKGYYYYLVKSLIKNLNLLPIEIILLVLFLQLMIPIAARFNLIPRQPTARIPFK